MNPPNNYKALLITRSNVISVLGIAVQDLLKTSCFHDALDDYVNHVVNFFTILEHVIYFCAKGSGLFFSQRMDQHPWKLFVANSKFIPNNSISMITQLDNLTDDFARIRAVFRMGLMEKRLHEYFLTAFSDKSLNKKIYSQHSIILCGHLPTVINQLIGLSAVDFSFDLKLNLNHQGFYPIDYCLYLTSPLRSQSILMDINEGDTHHNNDDYCTWREKYDMVLAKSKVDSEQKAYLEETIMTRDSQILALERRNELFNAEVKLLESSVTDLQVQLILLHEQYSNELDKVSGDSSTLNFPSVASVSGSRADFLSYRHPVTNQFTQIDASICSDLAKDNPNTSPLPQLAPVSFSATVQDCYLKLSKMAASNDDLTNKGASNSNSKDSLDNIQGKFVIGKQVMTTSTQRFYSPKNGGHRQCSSSTLEGSVTTPLIYGATNLDYPPTFDDMKLDEQRTRIMESQQLRKIMGQACRSPMIRAHQRCSQYVSLPKSQSYSFADSYSLDNFSISLNYSNSYENQISPDQSKNVFHSPDDDSNYYRLSSMSAFEELSDGAYFDVDSSRVDVLIHSVSEQPRATVTEVVQVLPSPEIVRQTPFITAEVPTTVEPMTRDYQHPPVAGSDNNYINGDRGSERQRHSGEEQ